MHTKFTFMLLRVLAMQLFLVPLIALPVHATGSHTNTVVESKGSCDLNCDETPGSPNYGSGNCLCDVDCLIRDDCCPDYNHFCLKENPKSRRRDPLTLMAASSLGMTVLADCYALPDYDKDPVIFVSTCRSGEDTVVSEKKDRLLCESKKTRCDDASCFLPVTDQDGYTYKNVYCARCNGIEANTIAFWKKQVACEKNEHVADILSSNNRTQHLLQMIEESCRVEFLAPNPAYPPLFCGLKPRRPGRTKHPKDTKFNVVDKKPGLLIIGPPAPAPAPTFTASFSILMNFGFNGKTHILFSGASQNPSASTVALCSADEIYDPFAEQCRKTHCEKGYEPVDGQCTLLTEIAKLNKSSTNERVYVVLDVVVPKADEEFYTSDEFKEVQLRDSVSSYLNITKDRLTQVHVYSPDSNVSVNNIPQFDVVDGVENVALKICVELEANPEEAVIFEAKLKDMSTLTVMNTVVFKVNVTRLSDDAEDEWCWNGHKILYLDKDFTVLTNYVVNNETTTAIYINKTDTLYTAGNFDLTVVVQGDILGKEITGFVFVCAVSIAERSCPMVKLNPKEYKILPNKSMVYHGEIFPENAYSDFEDGVEICIADEDTIRRIINMTALEFASNCNFENQWIFYSIQNYATAVVGILSIVTMVITLVVYAILDQLRNLPGYCTINLTLALLLAQSLFLFGSSKDECRGLCIAIAMTLHYLFLAAFFWMNILAYDVFRTFSQTGAGKRCQKIGRYLWKYMLYAWGSPAAIVGVCAAIDFIQIADNQDASIGYGWTKDDDGIKNSNYSGSETNSTNIYDLADFASGFANVRGCWIRQPTAALVAFGGPVIIIVFANAVLFSKTIIAIRASKKSSAQHEVRRVSIIDQVVVSQKLVENDFRIYVKISTLLGFTWVFGLTSSFISAFAGDDATATVCYMLHILNLLFTLANCSQGIFIFVAFICNRKTWNLFRETVSHFMSNGRLRNARPSRLSSSSNHPFVNSDREKDRAGDNPGFVGSEQFDNRI